MNKYILCMIAVLLSFGNILSAQNQLTIKGSVKDSNGEPLIGVYVLQEGTQNGTTSDIDGNYILNNVAPDAKLSYTVLGMRTTVEEVKGRSQINIIMEYDATELDETVVIGYGTMKKSDISGSSQGIKAESFKDQFLQTPEEALKGRIAGVKVSGGNAPGSGLSIQIRGTNSMLGGTEPLYVVDGFPIEPSEDAAGMANSGGSQSSINFINPNDIESIEVLKDASATAIYGARGANGVVLIQTKSGKKGRTKVTYNSNYGMVQIAKKIDVLDAEGYANYLNQKEINRFYLMNQAVELGILDANYLTENPLNIPYDGVNNPLPQDLPINTNWQDVVYRNAFTTDQNLTVQAGGENIKTAFSFGYTHAQGSIIETGMDRFTLSNMTEIRLFKGLKLKNKVNLAKISTKGGYTSTGTAFESRSIVTNALWCQPLYDVNTIPEDDDLSELNDGNSINNPYLVATLHTDDKKAFNVQDIMNLEYNWKNILTATGTAAFSHNANNRGQYYPMVSKRGMGSKGEAFVASNEMNKYMLEARLNYNQTFNKKHAVTAMAAVSYEAKSFNAKSNRYTGFASDTNTYHDLSQALNIYPTADNWWSDELISYIFRATYNFDKRYMLTATFRADGSSRGSLNHKYGYFPSIAAAWRLSEEPFMRSAKSWLSNAKLRLSWGIAGTYPNKPYQSLAKMEIGSYPFDGSLNSGMYESILPNPDLTWESTDQYNVGIDLSFLKGKVSLTMDYYYKLTHDLLQMVKIPPTTGYREMLQNLGEVENQGFEFNIVYNAIGTKNTNWSIFFNGGVNKNKLLSLGERDFITGPVVMSTPMNRFMVGQPLGVFWGLKSKGIFKDWDQVMNSPEGAAQRNTTPGNIIFENRYVDMIKDADGNLVPSPDQVINEKDYTIIGDPNPDFVFGFGTDFSYKNFDMSILFSGQIGGDIFWGDYTWMSNMWKPTNQLTEAANNAWIAPVQYEVNGHVFGSLEGNIENAKYPRALNWNDEGNIPFQNGPKKRLRYREDTPNDSNIHDGSFLKIQNISFGYTIPIKKAVESIRLGLSITNLYTFCTYPGYDPEIVSSMSPMMRGIDLGAYPGQRNFIASLQIKF